MKKEPGQILSHPIATEKSVRIMQAENKLVFIVERKATKPQIKKAAEELYKIKVKKVNTMIMPGGKKKAYLSLSPDTPAMDVATELGLK